MRKFNLLGCSLFTLLLLMSASFSVPLQAQIYQSAKTPKYVRSSAFDTVKSLGSEQDVYRRGIVTNETSLVADLLVYFGNASGVRDTTGFVRLHPGKILKFYFKGGKVFRKATNDSIYSQCIFGDIEIGFNVPMNSPGSEYYASISNEKISAGKLNKSKIGCDQGTAGTIVLPNGESVYFEIVDTSEYRMNELKNNYEALKKNSNFKTPIF